MRCKRFRGNGLWESMRLILPEHRAAIQEHRHRLHERVKPELDEQCLEELSRALMEAVATEETVRITTFGVYGDELVVGIVEKVDGGRVKVRTAGEVMWIPLSDIMDVQ